MDIFNSFLSAVMHVAIAIVLLVYLPISWLCKFAFFVFLRPFVREDLNGKVVLITGASSGIGEQLAYRYAKEGAYLVLVARRVPALKAVAKAARGYGSSDVLVIPADISDCDESKRVIDEAIAHFGQLNHLVVNAGIFSSCLFEEITNISHCPPNSAKGNIPAGTALHPWPVAMVLQGTIKWLMLKAQVIISSAIFFIIFSGIFSGSRLQTR